MAIADVWMVDPADVHESVLLSRYAALLPPDESAQLDRYRLAKLRHQYLVARVLVRTVLSARLGVSPADLALRASSSGRPELASGKDRLDFNLSHTDGLIVLAVTDGARIGVDVERYDRTVGTLALARRFFAPAEHAAIVAADEHRRRELFLAYWTLKEAYLKARGGGIADGLGSIAFTIDDTTIRVLTAPDDGASWRFVSWEPTPSHRAAVAVQTRDELELRVRRTVPLVREEPVTCRPIAASPPGH